MPLKDYIQNRTNRIVIGSTAAVGLIFSSAPAIYNSFVTPATTIENPNDGDVLFQISDHGAIGVGSGSDAFGSLDDCLKSGGGSGNIMSWGDCGSGGTSGGGSDWSNTGSLRAAFDQRYVNTAGDTMTGALTVKATISGSHIYAGTLSGAGLVDCDLSTNKLLWDATLQKFSCSNDIDTNTTYTAGQNLQLVGTSFRTNDSLTGSTVRGLNTLASSGTLIWETQASGSSLYIANSLQGVGLTDCDIAGSSKLLWDSTSGRFSCGTDANTTYTAGRGLGLNGTSFSLNATITGSLAAFQTISGSTVYGTNTVRSSGSLVWEGTASGAVMVVSSQFSGAGLVDCDLATQTLAWDAATNRFGCGTDSDTTYTAGQGLTLSSNSFRLSDSISGSILEFQTVSGSTVYATKSVRSSGALTWEGLGSGASLYVGGSLQGVGLVDCDTAATSKLLYDLTTGRFSCGADTNTTYTAGQGLTLTATSFRVSDSISGSLLEFQTVSGSTVYGSKSVRSSGALVWEGAASGATLYVASSLQGAGLVDCDVAGTSKLLWDATLGRFSCGTDTDTNTTYTAGHGLTLVGTQFRTASTVTGSIIKASTSLASSGTLVWEGAGSGQTLTVSSTATVGALTAVTLKNCAFLTTNSTGVFGCGTLPTRTIVLTAGGGLPSALTGSGASGPERYSGAAINDVSLYVLEFGNFAKGRYAMWTATMPDNYDGGTMTFKFNWKTAATSGDAKWYIQCRALGDGEAIDQSWGTAVGIADTAGGSANLLLTSSATAAVTCAGTPAGGEIIQFRVYRDGGDGADTLASTGALISVKGEYVTNSLSD